MKINIILCLGAAAVVNGWSVCSPKRIIKQRLLKKGLLVGAAAGAVVAGTAVTAAGAAVVYNQLNNSEVYEPAAGSMNNQVVLVTGGSSGLGLETAKRLAGAGATVVLTSRTGSKGQKAVDSVKYYLFEKGVDSSNVYSLPLDLDDLSNVKRFAESYKALELGDISVLVNNAGVMAIPDRELTVDGYERTFQSNHLGHFVLTAELFPYLSRNGAKVINVSSSASNFAAPGLDMDNLNGEKSYSAWGSYGSSKLANILFTKELQRKADAASQDWLTTVALHPGVVNTDLWRYIIGEERLDEIKNKDDGTFSIESLALSATSLFTKTPEQGASTQVFLAAADDDLVKGAFYDDMKEKTNLPSYSKDEEKAQALWVYSEELGDVVFDFSAKDVTKIIDAIPSETETESDDDDDDDDDYDGERADIDAVPEEASGTESDDNDGETGIIDAVPEEASGTESDNDDGEKAEDINEDDE